MKIAFGMLVMLIVSAGRASAATDIDLLAQDLMPYLQKESPKKLAILPFTGNSSHRQMWDTFDNNSYSSLGSYIANVLRTKLSTSSRTSHTEVLGAATIFKQLGSIPPQNYLLYADSVAAKTDADLVILGALVDRGESLQLYWAFFRPSSDTSSRGRIVAQGDLRLYTQRLVEPIDDRGLVLARRLAEALKVTNYAVITQAFAGSAKRFWTVPLLSAFQDTLAYRYGRIVSIGEPIPQTSIVTVMRLRFEGFDDTVEATATWRNTNPATSGPIDIDIQPAPVAWIGFPLPIELLDTYEGVASALLRPMDNGSLATNLVLKDREVLKHLTLRMAKRSLVTGAKVDGRARRSVLLPLYCEHDTLQAEFVLSDDDRQVEFYDVAAGTEPAWITETLKERLTRTRTKYEDATAKLALLSEVDTKRSLVTDGKRALADYGDRILDDVRSLKADGLAATIEPLVKAACDAPNKLTSTHDTPARSAEAQAVVITTLDTAFAKLTEIIDRMESWDSFTVGVELVSMPSEATVNMQVGESAASRRGPFTTTYTPRNIWRGRYQIEMTLGDAYKPAVVEVDLYREKVKRVTCKLARKSEAGASVCSWL